MESLAGQGINPYVIFVTAYTDRSMDAFAVGASAAQRPSLAGGRTRLLLAERGKVVVLAMRDIEFVQAAAKCGWPRFCSGDAQCGSCSSTVRLRTQPSRTWPRQCGPRQ